MDKRIVGKVAAAEWNDEEQGIDLILVFEPSGARLRGTCRSGPDPQTGRFLSAEALKANLARIRGMKVYWGGPDSKADAFDPAKLSQLVIQLDLSRMDLSVRPSEGGPDVNAFLSRILR